MSKIGRITGVGLLVIGGSLGVAALVTGFRSEEADPKLAGGAVALTVLGLAVLRLGKGPVEKDR